jgi:hypothetical protein
MYAKIQNNKTCPVDRFLVLGLTTSRDNDNAIGQFGSGSKHAVFTLLRAGLEVVIYPGQSEIRFKTKTKISGGHEYHQIYAIVDGEEQSMNVALDFGELDWKNEIDMAMRELVANAIDSSDSIYDVMISCGDYTPSPCENKTTVFVKANQEVKDYIADLDNRFLQFDGNEYKEGQIITKENEDKVRFYHKGVFVRFGDTNSLFDYNFGDDIKIDESRNLDNVSMASAVAGYLSKSSHHLYSILKILNSNKSYYETELYSFSLERGARNNKEIWQAAWNRVFGPKSVIVHVSDGYIIDKARNKDYKCILIQNNSWYSALVKAGIPTPMQVLEDVSKDGHEIIHPTSLLRSNFERVWDWFLQFDMNNDKLKPNLFMFRTQISGTKIKMGYREDDGIYINEECQTSLRTIFHEISHYISDAGDETREFEQFLVDFAVKVCE